MPTRRPTCLPGGHSESSNPLFLLDGEGVAGPWPTPPKPIICNMTVKFREREKNKNFECSYQNI